MSKPTFMIVGASLTGAKAPRSFASGALTGGLSCSDLRPSVPTSARH